MCNDGLVEPPPGLVDPGNGGLDEAAISRIDVPSNPFRANSSDAAARICRRRSGPFRKDFGFFVRAFARPKGFVIFFSVPQ
jgi:hypothetical protein